LEDNYFKAWFNTYIICISKAGYSNPVTWIGSQYARTIHGQIPVHRSRETISVSEVMHASWFACCFVGLFLCLSAGLAYSKSCWRFFLQNLGTQQAYETDNLILRFPAMQQDCMSGMNA